MPQASAKSIAAAKEKLMQALADLCFFGKKTFDINKVAEQAGYTCITGKAVRGAIKELKDECIFERTKDEITVTEEGIKSLPKADESNLPTDEGAQEKMLAMILTKSSSGGPIPNEAKTKAVFDLLLDGRGHSKEELAKAAGYARTDTKALRNLFKHMEALGHLEKADGGSLRLTESAWPISGRPTAQVRGYVDL